MTHCTDNFDHQFQRLNKTYAILQYARIAILRKLAGPDFT